VWVLSKEPIAWTLLLPLASSHTEPKPPPPLVAVPKRLPWASNVTGPEGLAPLVKSNEASALMVLLLLASSHTVPEIGPVIEGRAEEVTVGIQGDGAEGRGSVAGVEGGQGIDRGAPLRYSSN